MMYKIGIISVNILFLKDTIIHNIKVEFLTIY